MNEKTCTRCHAKPLFWNYLDNNPLCGFCRARVTLEEWEATIIRKKDDE